MAQHTRFLTYVEFGKEILGPRRKKGWLEYLELLLTREENLIPEKNTINELEANEL